MTDSTHSRTAGWIVYSNGHPVAAGPTISDATTTARRIGFPQGFPRPADISELESLDLPPSALNIAQGTPPWWHTTPHRSPPPAPAHIPRNHPAHLTIAGGETPLGPLVHAWTHGSPERRYIGVGRLIGFLHRERTYTDPDGSGMTPHFEIGADYLRARRLDDVALPIIEHLTENAFLGGYPRCPDCGGRIEWAEAGRVPGSRRCAGATEPDLHAPGSAASPSGITSDQDAGCGSTFIDTRFGIAASVPEDGRPE